MGVNSAALDCACCEEIIPFDIPCVGQLVHGDWFRNEHPLISTFHGPFAWQDQHFRDQEIFITALLFPPDGHHTIPLPQYFTPNRAANFPSKDCSEWVSDVPPPPFPNFKTCGPQNDPYFVGLQGCRFDVWTHSNGTTPFTPQYHEFLEPGMCWIPRPCPVELFKFASSNPSKPILCQTLAMAGDFNNLLSASPPLFQCFDCRHIHNYKLGVRYGWEYDKVNPPSGIYSMWDAAAAGKHPRPNGVSLNITMHREFAIAVTLGGIASGKLNPAGNGPGQTIAFRASLSVQPYVTDLDLARELQVSRVHNFDGWINDLTLTLGGDATICNSYYNAQVSSVLNEVIDLDITDVLKATSVRSGVLGIYCGLEFNGKGFAMSDMVMARTFTDFCGNPFNPRNPPLLASGYGSYGFVNATINGISFY